MKLKKANTTLLTCLIILIAHVQIMANKNLPANNKLSYSKNYDNNLAFVPKNKLANAPLFKISEVQYGMFKHSDRVSNNTVLPLIDKNSTAKESLKGHSKKGRSLDKSWFYGQVLVDLGYA